MNIIDFTQCVQSVGRKLSKYPNLEYDDKLHVCMTIADLLKKDFTVNDTVEYVRCTEEYDPTVDEDFAIDKMAKISAKYSGNHWTCRAIKEDIMLVNLLLDGLTFSEQPT